MGGMIAATVLGGFFIPLLFVAVRRIFRGNEGGQAIDDEVPAAQPAEH
jgi:multidrug efflux pump